MSDKDSSKKASGNCLNCSREFTKIRQHQKFCSPRCRWLHWRERHPEFRLSRQEWKKLKKMLAENPD